MQQVFRQGSSYFDISLCTGTINKFYNNPKVQEKLHTRPTQWKGCTGGWAKMLLHDKPVSVVPYIAELLDETDIRILFFNGDRDLLCCNTGTELMLESMKWSKAEEWKTAPRGVWMVNDRVAGYTRALDNMQFVTVYNSGHMVYYNQPARCLDMVTRFLKGESLLDVGLPSYPREPLPKRIYETFVFKALVGFLVGVLVFFAWRRWTHREKRTDYEEVATSYQDDNGKGN